MKERQYLKKTVLLCGESDGAVFKRTFHIVKRISEGASSVCYEAYHGNSGRGVLKEFYPQDAYGLARDKDGQLVHSMRYGDAYDRFKKAESAYLEPYHMMLKAKQSGERPDLATFIPAFEIYHGCDKNGNVIGTTYVWTPEPKLETFDVICGEIHKHPRRGPEHKLVTVLTAVESLARCVCALHQADIIHRDIKPSNFGFLKRGSETLTQTLSLFDINSVCSVNGDTLDPVGTEGYMEPEAGYEFASNQTDIYSIGATLFTAIIVTDETRAGEYLYRDEYYARLQDMVDGSELIQASEANAHPRLRHVLAAILKKCLCERDDRYENCEKLIGDLEKALYYALPAEFAGKQLSGERWILADVEKSLDINAEKDSFLAIQYHLYAHPLYLCSPRSGEALHVLVIGFGNYGQKFLDACLQNGQIRGKKLCVTIVSDDEQDRALYLSERPALADFFHIDGPAADDRDTYGELTFECRTLERGDRKALANTLQDIMCEHYDDKRPHYIFIALGDDGVNIAAANACRTAAEVLEADCVVSYVCEKQRPGAKPSARFCPVYVNGNMRDSPLHEEIERMAFNTHLVWEKDLNLDYRLVKSEFKKPYYHDSCVSSVLSLKYKLYSMGIDLDAVSFEEAARSFRNMLGDKSNRGLKNELIWIEHRRWVTEKLCQGWRRIADLEECAGGVTKDTKGKKHVCILRSRPDQKLAAEFRSSMDLAKWDSASDEELDQLDELDRMSVQLHRMFVRRAKAAKEQDLLNGSSITGIRTLIEGDRKAVVPFQEWFTCLKDIWTGDRAKVQLYKGLKNAFLSALDGLPDDKRNAVYGHVKAFEAVYRPVLASMEYRDWKQDDVALIDNIPFVLTYTENAYLAIPFATGGNADVFENVSAATVVSPSRILYLYSIDKKRDVSDLLDALPYVVGYMGKKRFKAAVEFVITVPEAMVSVFSDETVREIIRLGGGRIRQVKRIVLAGSETAAQALGAYLKRRSADKRFFAVEKNETRLSAFLLGARLYDGFSSYAFRSADMVFRSLSGCDMLRYIKKAPYITVSDMAAFRLSSSDSSNQPEFFQDYKALWEKYTENRGLWKQLCDLLGDYSKKNDTLASFKKKASGEKTQKPERSLYILPFACSRSAAKILRFLKEHDIAEQESFVRGYTTDSCQVVIVDRRGYRKRYDKLFANVYALMLPDAISLHLNTKSHEVKVVFDDLAVRDLPIPAARVSEVSALMGFFREKGYVLGLAVTPEGRMSFTYATRRIKELLNTAGKMLEVYTYHKVKEYGRFDDVISSFEIDWEGTGVRSEFDCILTKGFRTLFVECKARSDIEQDFYFKLASQVEQFEKVGINATAVLIADTQEKSSCDNAPVNAMQRKRGSMMDVVTIWKPEEINDIGKTLMKVINGSYVTDAG